MSAKTQTKNAAKSAKASTPPVETVTLSADLHTAILNVGKALDGSISAAGGLVGAVITMLKAIEYTPACVTLARADVLKMSATRGKEAGLKLAGMVNSASAIVIGGTKAKVQINGKGLPALLAVLAEKYANLNKLAAALSEAKPAGLKKDTSGAQLAKAEKAAAKKGPGKAPEKAAGAPIAIDDSPACRATIASILKSFVLVAVKPGSESQLMSALTDAISLLEARVMTAAELKVKARRAELEAELELLAA